MSSPARASWFAQILLLLGGTSWIYALFVAFSAATGKRFEIMGDGNQRGVPLAHTWPYAALFVAIGGALWLSGRRWDAPGFVALRRRRPWLVPLVGTVVILPASLVLIFLLVR